MKKISHSVLFVLLSAIGGMALAANYYPPSDIIETTDPAAARCFEAGKGNPDAGIDILSASQAKGQ